MLSSVTCDENLLKRVRGHRNDAIEYGRGKFLLMIYTSG